MTVRELITTASFTLLIGGTLMTDPAGATSADALAWLEGTWANETFEARYSSPRGGMVLSVSKEFGDRGQAIFFELERFEAVDGVLTLVTYPQGKQSVAFKLAEYDAAARKAVFANAAHDWPTHISYQRAADDRLIIVVAGPGRSWALELRRQ